MKSTSLSNLFRFNKLLVVLRQSTEMLKIRSVDADVAGTKISQAILEINGNLLTLLILFVQNSKLLKWQKACKKWHVRHRCKFCIFLHVHKLLVSPTLSTSAKNF